MGSMLEPSSFVSTVLSNICRNLSCNSRNQDNEGDAEYTFFDKDGVKKVNIKKQKVSGNMEEKRVSNIIPFPRKNDLEVK